MNNYKPISRKWVTFKMNSYIIITILCVFFIDVTICETSACESKLTCSDCIRNSNCSWHIQQYNEYHCVHSNVTLDNTLEIINPKTEGFTSKDNETEHIIPRSVFLKIRPGESYSFGFKYFHQVQYPVDIYFLMDISKSMQYYRTKISEIASDLTEKMKEKTSDVRIGFGSFVDKTILPFVHAIGDDIKTPCSECAKPYSFKNHLKLTENVSEFAFKVDKEKISANIDAPEGSLEALLQVIVCTKEIGWRKNARHLIILSTDDTFHVAGDGKLAGIVEPNDGRCHLKDGVYSHGLLQDYPSIGQISEKAKKENKNILFLITPSQEKLYGKLQEVIPNSYIGTLQNNSNNIINLVIEFYENITSSVKINDYFPKDNFDITLKSFDCETFSNNSCNGTINGETYRFDTNIYLKTCPTNGKYIDTYEISLSSLSDKISIQVEMLCNCPCETDEVSKIISEDCSSSGRLVCGVCACNSGKMGDKCQCDNSTSVNLDDSLNCKTSVTDKDVCNGNGDCICGQCNCNKRFSGKYCECDNEKCFSNKETREICSSKGNCECGQCKCFQKYSGDFCDCYQGTDTCQYPGRQEICSGNGDCICGKCSCTDKDTYAGKYCEECKTCFKTCNDFENCVRCYYTKNKCDPKCENFNINQEYENHTTIETICNYNDEDNCLVTFRYEYDTEDLTAEIYTQKTCPTSTAGVYTLAYIISSILILGILSLLLWKIITFLQDRREYEKFVNETKNPQWHNESNPLFKDPVSEFQNPLFKKTE